MLRVSTVFSGVTGTPYYNDLHFGGSGVAEAQAAADAADGFWRYFTNQLRNVMVATISPEVFEVDVATGQATGSWIVTSDEVLYTSVDQPLPPSNQGLIRLRTSLFVAGRRLRGRIFVPGLTEAWSDDGTVDGSLTTRLTDGAATLLSLGEAAGGLVVFSPTHKVAAPVTQALPWGEFAVQRSRRD